ncbi:MAG: hypothetical protein HRU09_01635 [Oligoflexales bacterium]|nr:hypothetical protein [Oligoflexales bacterium]
MRLLLAQAILISSNSLFDDAVPSAARRRVLSSYFKPSYRQTVEIDPHEIRERKYLNKPHLMKGYITVSPPKGHCFTIRVNPNRPGYRVCSAKKVPFKLADINGKGEITWTIITGPNDFGTQMTWKTSYRIGRVVDHKMVWPGPSRDLVVKSCRVKKRSKTDRQIILSFFYQGDWTIRIPASDRLVAQPKRGKPNLYVQQSEFASSFAKIAKAKAKKEQEEQTGTKTVPDEIEEDPNTIESTWQMHPRNAYSLPTNNVLLGADSPQGSRGKCQYRLDGHENDPASGVLECHSAGPYQWVYMPISCIGELVETQ